MNINDNQPEGYLHPLYAQSFTNIGEPLFLPRCKGWLIKRQIPGTFLYDAMGPYPLFFCEDWQSLIDDLKALADQLISVSFVIGPFSEIPIKTFMEYFDQFYVYKEHYIYDTNLSLTETISKYRIRDARRALRNLTVEHKVSPDINLVEWTNLYNHLIKRHNITGIRSFSKDCFAKQLAIPNTHYFRALLKDEIVGGNIFFIQRNVAYGHLLALTPLGYKLGASHAIKWIAIQDLSNIVRWINFGGGTSRKSEQTTGLDQFKQSWTNTKKETHFCGKIFHNEIYHHLARINGLEDRNWFPSYRYNDF